MNSFNNLKIQDIENLETFKSLVLSTVLTNEDSENLSILLRLDNDLAMFMLKNKFSKDKQSQLIKARDAKLFLSEVISTYLDKFSLLMSIDEIKKCVLLYKGEKLENLRKLINIKEECSLVESITSESVIPSMSGSLLCSVYKRNLIEGFLDEKRIKKFVEKMCDWIKSEPSELKLFLEQLPYEQKVIFATSKEMNDFYWKNNLGVSMENENEVELLKAFYLNDPERINSYNLEVNLIGKISILNMLEVFFKKTGDFTYIQRELDNAHLWIYREDFIKTMEMSSSWDDLSFANEKVTKDKPSFIFYYLMQKYQPKFIDLFTSKLMTNSVQKDINSKLFPVLLNECFIGLYNTKEKIKLWPEDLIMVFNKTINNNLLIVEQGLLLNHEKSITDFMIENFNNALISSTLYKINDDDELVSSRNFFGSPFIYRIKPYAALIPFILSTEKDEEKLSVLSLIKFLYSCHESKNGDNITESFDMFSFNLLGCKDKHYNLLLNAIKSFSGIAGLNGETGLPNHLVNTFFYGELTAEEMNTKMENFDILVEQSVLSNFISKKVNINKVRKF